MKVDFQGYAPSTQTVELNSDDLSDFRQIVNDRFTAYIAYANLESGFLLPEDQRIVDFCARFSVDGKNKTARIAFFEALLAQR